MYYVAQAMGLLVTLLCIVGPYWKYRWQMLLNTLAANLLAVVSTWMLEGFCSAVAANLLAVVQVILALLHLRLNKKVTVWENVVFLIAYAAFGILGYRSLPDLLAIVGSVLFMIGSFERDEQRARLIYLGNAATYMAYYAIIGSTTMFAQVVSIVNNTASWLIYHRKRKNG